jgi:hypothetical protein
MIPLHYALGGLFAIAGLFYTISAASNWAVFMRQKQARTMSEFLGYKGARLFYFVVGLVCFTCGTLALIYGLPFTGHEA